MGPIWDAELRVWDAKNFGLVSPGTHRNKFVKKSLPSVVHLQRLYYLFTFQVIWKLLCQHYYQRQTVPSVVHLQRLYYFSGNMEVVMSTALSQTNITLSGSFTEIVLLFQVIWRLLCRQHFHRQTVPSVVHLHRCIQQNQVLDVRLTQVCYVICSSRYQGLHRLVKYFNLEDFLEMSLKI